MYVLELTVDRWGKLGTAWLLRNFRAGVIARVPTPRLLGKVRMNIPKRMEDTVSTQGPCQEDTPKTKKKPDQTIVARKR